MVYCTKCGAEIPEGANFCQRCGTKTAKGSDPDRSGWEADVESALQSAVRSIEEGFRVAKESIWDSTRGFTSRRASKRKSFTGVLEDEKAVFSVENINGPVRISTWDKHEYSVDLFIEAGGSSLRDAERNLEDLYVNVVETATEDQKRLELVVEKKTDAWRYYSVSIDVKLPNAASMDLYVASKNGGIQINKLSGSKANLFTNNGYLTLEEVQYNEITGKTSNGHLTVRNVKADEVNMQTSNGRIEGSLEGANVALKTSNGKIYLNLPCTIDGSYKLNTSNGGIEVKVPRLGEIGFDLDLHTNLSSVYIDLPGMEYYRDRKNSKVARTLDLDSKDVKVKIVAGTSLGRIEVFD
jgi:DUF4097 and DUF4098 domain-containing protein YvlB